MKPNTPTRGSQRTDRPSLGARVYPQAVGFSQIGLFVLAMLYSIYLVRPFLLPVILALLLAMVLNPVANGLQKLTRLPSPLTAFIILSLFCSVAGTGLYYTSYPASEYADKLREEIVQNRLRSVFAPITELHEEIKTVAEEVETLAGDNKEPQVGDPAPVAPNLEKLEITIEPTAGIPLPSADNGDKPAKAQPVQVEIRESRVDVVYTLAQDFMLHLTLTLIICFFLLAFGNQMIRRMAENRVAKHLIHDISRDVSGYLLTVTLINLGLGTCIGVAMWILGLPNPLLWGAMAALLNFIPYIGALAGTAIIFLVAATNTSSTALLIGAPATYYLLTALEGNIVTPAIIGKRFTINPIVVFLWVLGWGGLWGVPGMLIGLPLLMIFRIIVDSVPALSGVNRVISS